VSQTLSVVLGVVAVAVALVLLLGKSRGAPLPGGAAAYAADQTASVVSETVDVAASEAGTIGLGSAQDLPSPLKGPALTAGGRPEMLYIGAEFCPYCATERWAMVNALSRFGTFSHLGLTHSSSTDAFANTPSFTFHGSSFSSPWLTFVPVEVATNQPGHGLGGYRPLDTPTPAEQRVWESLDPSGGIPFVDIGGRYLVSGATYDPTVLQAKTPEQVAASLSDPASPIARGVIGTANSIVAAICKVTTDQPSQVCTTPAIRSIEARLG
jgi:hypothetical protein